MTIIITVRKGGIKNGKQQREPRSYLQRFTPRDYRLHCRYLKAKNMKMYLLNILNHLEASEDEITIASSHFENERISYSEVRKFLVEQRVNMVS